jgi:hypothetical protein
MTTAKATPRNLYIADAAPGTTRIRGELYTVIRGTIAPGLFDLIVVPDYQREAMRHHKHWELIEALSPTDGIGVPDDLLLSVRTETYRSLGGGRMVIPSTLANVLDGHQRVAAAWARLEQSLPVDPFGVKIILGTTLAVEKEIFRQVNRLQTPVSTDVHISNMDETPAMASLRKMIEDSPSLITVRWGQLAVPGEDIKVRMLYELAVILHGGGRPGTIEQIQDRLERCSDEFGTEQLTANVKAFFETVIRCFRGTDKEQYMFRIDLLRALARLFWEHADFWDSKNSHRLSVRVNDINKLKTMRAKTIANGLDQSTAATDLFELLMREVNKTRRTKLVPRS